MDEDQDKIHDSLEVTKLEKRADWTEHREHILSLSLFSVVLTTKQKYHIKYQLQNLPIVNVNSVFHALN